MDTNGNINRLFVPYELALKLKEKGFDEPCMIYYSGGMLQLNTSNIKFGWKDRELVELDAYENKANNSVAAPLYQQVIDFFREKHDIHIWISTEVGYNITYCWQMTGENRGSNYGANNKTYYEALNKAIEEAIKLI